MNALPAIAISTLSRAANDAATFGATKVLSIVDPEDTAPPMAAALGHLVLRFHDVEDLVGCRCSGPSGEHIAQIIAFAGTLTPEDRCLVHCHAGISRSPAAVLIILAVLTGSAAEAVIALRALEPVVYHPNSLMLDLADLQLRLNPSLGDAIAPLRAAIRAPTADQIW